MSTSIGKLLVIVQSLEILPDFQRRNPMVYLGVRVGIGDKFPMLGLLRIT